MIILSSFCYSQEIVPKINKPFLELNKDIDFNRIIKEKDINEKVDNISKKLKLDKKATVKLESFFSVNEYNKIIMGNTETKPRGYETIAEEMISGFSLEELKQMAHHVPIPIMIKITVGNYKKRIKKRLKLKKKMMKKRK